MYTMMLLLRQRYSLGRLSNAAASAVAAAVSLLENTKFLTDPFNPEPDLPLGGFFHPPA